MFLQRKGFVMEAWLRISGYRGILSGYMGFPGGSDVKESACNVGDLGSVSGWGRSLGGGDGNPLQYSCLENPYGQRSLVGYSQYGHKESGVTEKLCVVQGSEAEQYNYLS